MNMYDSNVGQREGEQWSKDVDRMERMNRMKREAIEDNDVVTHNAIMLYEKYNQDHTVLIKIIKRLQNELSLYEDFAGEVEYILSKFSNNRLEEAYDDLQMDLQKLDDWYWFDKNKRLWYNNFRGDT